MSKVIVYSLAKNRRSQGVTKALCAGLRQVGYEHTLKNEAEYTQPEKVDCVMMYGLAGNMRRIMKEYREANITTCFWDLGYFGRKRESPPLVEFHRVAVNGYHATPYLLSHEWPTARFLQFNRPILPWQADGEEILVSGMSEKSSRIHGLGGATEYSTWLVNEVRKHTDRPIAYSPKPSWKDAVPIAGTRYARGTVQEVLRNVFCTISWGSNLAIDGIIAGIPCIVLSNHPASLMGHSDLSRIESPKFPSAEERLRFCAGLASCQFSLSEMSTGYAFRALQAQGLLP